MRKVIYITSVCILSLGIFTQAEAGLLNSIERALGLIDPTIGQECAERGGKYLRVDLNLNGEHFHKERCCLAGDNECWCDLVKSSCDKVCPKGSVWVRDLRTWEHIKYFGPSKTYLN